MMMMMMVIAFIILVSFDFVFWGGGGIVSWGVAGWTGTIGLVPRIVTVTHCLRLT